MEPFGAPPKPQRLRSGNHRQREDAMIKALIATPILFTIGYYLIEVMF